MNKLEPIAALKKEMLEAHFNIEVKYSFEQKKEWLLNVPDKKLYNKPLYELFPEMYESAKQDNRLRQRAFRGFLKDIVPLN